MFETFDHTADLGLRIRAADLPALFAESAAALASVLVTDPKAIQPREERTLELSGDAVDFLLFDWLSEILYWFEQHWLVADAAVNLREDGLQATLRGEPYDPDRHILDHEVKAITYHNLLVEQRGSEWRAEVIIDI